MRWPFKLHHKVGAGVAATTFTADKAFDIAKEHLTVATHDWIAHLGYSWILIAGCAGLVLIPAYIVRQFHKGPSDDETGT